MDKSLILLEPRNELIRSFELQRKSEKIIISCMFIATRDKNHGDTIFVKIAEMLAERGAEAQKEFEQFFQKILKIMFCNFMSRSRKNRNKTLRETYQTICRIHDKWDWKHLDEIMVQHVECMMKAVWRAIVREQERESRFAKFIETDFDKNSRWFVISSRSRKKIDD